MRLAISNIAWEISEDEEVARLLQEFGIDAIDIAPGKYFPDPKKTDQKDAERVKHWWRDRGIEVAGMQALLFGTVGLNVFGSKDVQDSLLRHLSDICRIASCVGATRLVFGSPKNRDRRGFSDQQALDEAVSFFSHLGDIALEFGVIICLEPNPICYGANFMTTSSETALVVRAISHPAIRMQLDTGALTINKESIETVLDNCADLIGHVHASEPSIVPLGDAATDHVALHGAISRYLPDHLVSIEMLATKDEPHLIAIERALSCATKCYRPEQGVTV